MIIGLSFPEKCVGGGGGGGGGTSVRTFALCFLSLKKLATWEISLYAILALFISIICQFPDASALKRFIAVQEARCSSPTLEGLIGAVHLPVHFSGVPAVKVFPSHKFIASLCHCKVEWNLSIVHTLSTLTFVEKQSSQYPDPVSQTGKHA